VEAGIPNEASPQPFERSATPQEAKEREAFGGALGRPTIVIFGPTNPLTTRPFAPEAVILRHPPDCAPCMLRDCPIDHRCMTAITVDEVFEQSHALLKRGSFAKTVRSLCDSVA
jgi:hypothetical protein